MRTNDSLLNDREHECIVHALGLTRRCASRGKFGRRWAYRNYFAAGDQDVPIWRSLEKRGLARITHRRGSHRPFHTFAVTLQGVIAADLQKYVPKSMIV